MDKVIDFLRNISNKDEIIIVYNNDGDGACSCACLLEFLKRTGRKEPFIISQPMPPEKNLIKKIQTSLPSKIIFLDMAMDQQDVYINKLKGISDILIIDHHKIIKNINSKNVVHYNPRYSKSSIYQSTSYLVYKICSRVADMSDILWIAGVGMVSDYNLDDSGDIVNEIRKRYNIEKPLYETFFGRIADMIAATKATKAMNFEEIVKTLRNTENPEHIDKISKKMFDAYMEIENEIMTILSDIDTNKEQHKDIIFYNIKSKYNISSPISTKYSEKHKNKIIIIYYASKGMIKVSARCQGGKYDVGHLLNRAAWGIEASGGGHEAAAGATMKEKEWTKFKEKVIELASYE